MRKILKFAAFYTIIFLLLAAFAQAFQYQTGDLVIVKAKNSLVIDRPHEMVSLRLDDLYRLLKIKDYNKICIYDALSKDTLVTQCVDENQDGTPEEIIFNSNFKAKETKKFIVKISDKQKKSAAPMTFAKLMFPREDLAWENDRIAFRIYGPPLAKESNNGIDVWTKRVRYPIVEKWYKGDEAPDSVRVSYHEDHGEGADFFNVGKTLGAGGSALFRDGSLCQPGVFMTSKVLATGPIRTVFEVTYRPVTINGINISEVKRFTLDAGSNLNKIEVKYLSDSVRIPMQIAAGLVKRNGVSMYSDKNKHWISLWGPTNEKAENGSLGTAVVVSSEVFSGILEDSVHVLLIGTVKLGVPVVYYAGAGWTRSGDFNTAADWNKYLAGFSLRLKSPLRITLSLEK